MCGRCQGLLPRVDFYVLLMGGWVMGCCGVSVLLRERNGESGREMLLSRRYPHTLLGTLQTHFPRVGEFHVFRSAR